MKGLSLARPNLPMLVQTNGHDASLTSFVDSCGKPVSCWPSKLLPSTCVLVTRVTRHAQQLLCHLRSDNVCWGFLGGAQHIGESIEDCAIREVEEESGLHVTLTHLLCVDSDPRHGSINVYPDGHIVQYTCVSFAAEVLPTSPKTLRCSPESLALRWCRLDQLPSPFLPV